MVAYSETHTTFCTTTCQYLAAVGSCHSFAEAMLVHSLAVRRLECSFHCRISVLLVFFNSSGKGIKKILSRQLLLPYFSIAGISERYVTAPVSLFLTHI